MKKKENKDTIALKNSIIEAILDRKAQEVVELDLRDITDSVADYFIVCHADNTIQVNAIAEGVRKDVKDNLGETPQAQEGKQNAQWIILDYFDIVVHVFYNETRQYYQLEELWSDAIATEYE